MNDEMSAALDNIGVPGDDDPIINADPPKIEPEEEIDEIEEIENDPPGFISHADYVEKHGNDDGWKGKDAYSAEYERIQDNKALRGEIKNLTSVVQTTIDATNQMQSDKYQQGLADAKADLDQAIRDNDAEAAVVATNKINSIPTPSAPAQVNPIHGQFFSANAVIDQGSAEYDAELMAEFTRIHDGRLRADGVTGETVLTERAMNAYMKSALEGAKALFPEKFESTRNNRKTTGKARRSTEKGNPVDAIKNVKVETRNPRDNNAMMDTYNAIKEKGGQEAADNFAKAMGVNV